MATKEEQIAYVKKVSPAARRTATRLNVDPQSLIAQSALETDYGNVSSNNNLFNIKGKGGLKMNALEYDAQGNQIREPSEFAGYDSISAGFDGYADFIENNPRYTEARKAGSGDDYIRGIAAAGYATDPEYANKILEIKKTVSGIPLSKTWNEVVQSEGYQTLNDEQKGQAQNQYFNEVIAPVLSEGQLEEARTEFLGSNVTAESTDPVGDAEASLRAQVRQGKQDAVTAKTEEKKVQLGVDPSLTFEAKKAPTPEETANGLIARSRVQRSTAGGYLTQPPEVGQPTTATTGSDFSYTTQPEQGFTETEGNEGTNQARFDMLAQGVSFGFSDEIEGAVKSAIGDQDYQAAVDEARERVNAGREQLGPLESAAYEIVGSLPVSLIPAGWVGRGATLGSRAGRLAVAGGIEGGVAGAGTSTADVRTGEFASDVGLGAGAGAAFASVLGVGGERVVDTLSRLPGLDVLSGGSRRIANDSIRSYAEQNNIPIDDVIARLERLETGGLADVRLADIEELSPLIEDLNKTVQLDSSIRSELGQRAGDQVAATRNQLDPVREVGDTVLQRQVQVPGGTSATREQFAPYGVRSENIDQTIRVGSDADLTAEGRLRLNQLASDVSDDTQSIVSPLYREAFDNNNVKLKDIPQGIRITPEFEDAYKEATDQVVSYNLRNNLLGPISQTHILHQTQQLLGDRIKRATGLDKSNLSGIRRMVSETLLSGDRQYEAANSVYKQGRTTQEAFDLGNKLNSTNLSRVEVQDIATTLEDTGSLDAAMLTYGQKLADKIDNGWRDGKTGKLLNQKERETLQEILRSDQDRYKVVDGLLHAQDRAIRTQNLAKLNSTIDRRDFFGKLLAKIDTNDMNLVFSAGAAILRPSVAATGWAVRKFGESGLLKRDSATVNKLMQKELFKAADADSVRAFFKGDLDAVPKDKLRKILDVLGIAVGANVAGEAVEQNDPTSVQNQNFQPQSWRSNPQAFQN